MTAAPTPGVLFTDCRHCDGSGCSECRDACPICNQLGRTTLASLGGRYCDAHDPDTAGIPY